jgi:hypothetical protein
MHDLNRVKSAYQKIEQSQPAEWVREMRDHYRRTGEYRPRDIRRVMGDQTETVKVGTDPTIAALKLER